jgi:hypothetical protein
MFGVVSSFTTSEASASAPRVVHPVVRPLASTTCKTLTGVTLSVGSINLTVTPGQLKFGDDSDPIYGNGIAPATVIVTVSNPTSAIMSNPATVTENNATLTICPKGSGSITCTNVSGSLRFSPGLLIKTQPVKMTLAMTITGCTTSPGPTSGPVAIAHVANYDAWTSKTAAQPLSCADFETGTTFSESSVPTKGKVAWNVPLAKASTFSFGGFSITAPQGGVMMTFPNTGGTVSVHGGYAGSTASVSLIANPNLTPTGPCTSIAGVRSFVLSQGTVTFGQAGS